MTYEKIIIALIALISAVVSAFLIPLIRSKVSHNDLLELQTWIDTFVRAAEQTIGDASARKKWVVAQLEAIGYSVDESVLDAIESSVLNLHRELFGEWSK